MSEDTNNGSTLQDLQAFVVIKRRLWVPDGCRDVLGEG